MLSLNLKSRKNLTRLKICLLYQGYQARLGGLSGQKFAIIILISLIRLSLTATYVGSRIVALKCVLITVSALIAIPKAVDVICTSANVQS